MKQYRLKFKNIVTEEITTGDWWEEKDLNELIDIQKEWNNRPLTKVTIENKEYGKE